MYILDLPTLTWSKPQVHGTMTPRRAHTAALIGKLIYIFGGGNVSGVQNELLTLDTESMTFAKVATEGDVPQARGFHTMCCNGTELIVYGGTDAKIVFSDVSVLDTTTNVWSRKKVITPKSINSGNPPARLAHAAVMLGSTMFVIGGLDGSKCVNDVLCLDFALMAWKRPPMLPCMAPAPRGYHALAAYRDRVFLFGGTDNKAVFDDVHLLELSTYSMVFANDSSS